MIVYPAIDLIQGEIVRLRQGDFNDTTVYPGSPLEAARQFEAAGLTHLHVVDLDGARTGSQVNLKSIEAICNGTRLKVDTGGGIKSEADIRRLLDLGVNQVNLGSIAIREPGLVINWLSTFGAERIILSADVKDGEVVIHGWTASSGVTLESHIRQYLNAGLKYVTCTDVAMDGMMGGPNMDLYKNLLYLFPDLYIIASGGVGSIDDLKDLRSLGVAGVITGKAIYEGKISLGDLATYNSHA